MFKRLNLADFDDFLSLTIIPECIRIVRELCDTTVITGQDAVFEVELSHSGVTDGQWWLEDNLLQNNDLNQMSSHSRVHRLVLKMVTTDETGDVAFVLGEEKSVASLLVEEKPKGKQKTTILLLTYCKYFMYLEFYPLMSG